MDEKLVADVHDAILFTHEAGLDWNTVARAAIEAVGNYLKNGSTNG